MPILALLPTLSRLWPLAVIAAAFAGGWYVQGKRCSVDALETRLGSEKTQKEALAATITAFEKVQTAAAKHSDQLEARLAVLAKENRSLAGRLSHETRSDSYRCTLPANGLRLLNAARTGAAPDAAGEPDGRVPNAGGSTGRCCPNSRIRRGTLA